MSQGVRRYALVKASERRSKGSPGVFGVKRNVCCDALVVASLGVGPSVAPIEGVQLRIGVLKLKR